MKNFISKNKLSFFVATLFGIFTVFLYVMFETKCFEMGCNPEFRDGTVIPLFWFGITATPISIFFLFFPQSIFVSWLKHVASWYLPVLFILTVTTPVYSGHVMSVDRGVVVLWGMIVLGLISVVYALAMKKKVSV